MNVCRLILILSTDCILKNAVRLTSCSTMLTTSTILGYACAVVVVVITDFEINLASLDIELVHCQERLH